MAADQTCPVVACTGHRNVGNPGTLRWVRNALLTAAATLKNQHGTTEAITGMALGADTQWAWAAHNAGLNLAAYIPFEDQPQQWGPHARQEWRQLRKLAHREVVVGTLEGLFGYDRRNQAVQLLHARNDAMLQDCTAVVAVWDGREQGGTYSAVVKAQRMRRPLIRINPVDRTVTWPSTVEVTLW